MKAAVRDRYGPPEVVRVEDVPTPVPAAGQLVVRVRAAGANRASSMAFIHAGSSRAC